MTNKVCSKCNLRKDVRNFKKESDSVCISCTPKKPKKAKKED